MSTSKSTFFMLFGILFGFCLGLVIRNYRALEIVKKCDQNPSEKRKFIESIKSNILLRTNWQKYIADPSDIINLHPNDTVLNSQKNLLFVGVMTAQNFLQGRAKAVFDTWGKEIPGKIAFFSSEKSYSECKSFRRLFKWYTFLVNCFSLQCFPLWL